MNLSAKPVEVPARPRPPAASAIAAIPSLVCVASVLFATGPVHAQSSEGVQTSAAGTTTAASPAAPAPSSSTSDSDAWYRGAARDEQQRRLEQRRESEQARAREAEEHRKWFVGLSGGAGVASGSKDFRADYLQASLVVTRYSLELSSPDNAFIAIEVPTRRYIPTDGGDTAWGTGMYVFGGVQAWWVFASLGVGAGLMPGASGGATSLGVRARLGVRLWRFALAGEAGGSCGDSRQGGLVTVGEAGGLLLLDLAQPFR